MIDTKSFAFGKNARRGNVSVVSPSSAAPSPVTSTTESPFGAFQENAFQGDAFETT